MLRAIVGREIRIEVVSVPGPSEPDYGDLAGGCEGMIQVLEARLGDE
jgi:hypothetical protein